MAVAQGSCPNCGAPTEFGVGASVSKVCPFCRHVILRTDRDWRSLGKIADLANTPSVLSVGDRGTVRGVGFEVVGRLQMDFGRGPWDEFYVAFADGSWGWIASAQGNVYVTKLSPEPVAVPPATSLAPDQPVTLGRYGIFRVAERRTAKFVSLEGELPGTPAPERLYADLTGADGAFATLDYGDGTGEPRVFVGRQIPVAELVVTPRGGEKSGGQKVKLANLTCPNCGGALPAPSDPGIERVACKYCNAISELDGMKVIARQAQAFARPKIPVGSSAVLVGTRYTVIGYVERSAAIDGERFRWFEYLLYGERLGFRWLVEDEGTWLFIRGIAGGEVQTSGYNAVAWHGRTFGQRNRNQARVDYVVGEFYWKVEVGETVEATDYISGGDVISREASGEEVNWSYGQPVAWANIAKAFNLPVASGLSAFGAGGAAGAMNYASGSGARPTSAMSTFLVVGVIVLVLICIAAGSSGSGGGFSFGGGGGGYGGFGGK